MAVSASAHAHDRRGPTPRVLRAAVGVGAPVVAFAAQRALWPYIPPSPQLLFYPAVFLAARVGGARAGYVATGLSAIAMAYQFLPPYGGLGVNGSRDALDLSIFCAVSIAMSYAVGRLGAMIARERAARQATERTWSMIAHDLRTPLHTIRMGSDLLAHGSERTDPDVRRQAEIIERSSLRAASLVQDALDAMRIHEGTLPMTRGVCSLREVVARVADEASVPASRAGVRIETIVATTHATVVCDAARIAQVLANLLANALRFTPKGGIVLVVAEDAVDGEVRVEVRDSGRGIAGEDLGHVFEHSWTKGSGGSGLGLWIARTIVEAHERTLTVASDPGEGTTFTFTLPAGPS